ncbi:MAG: hypothetical protein K8S18_19685 [Desulfobacula sp.]|nr:hypothetical protein [Desulfobacula sp.]
MSEETLTIEPLTIELFKKLLGRTSAYYLYNESGGGGTARGKTTLKNYGDLPLTVETIQQHLNKEITIGIYPHDSDDKCVFFAIDIDFHEDKGDDISKKETNFKDARKIQKHLWKKYKLASFIEKSGSEKSFHIWIFLESTPGSEIRRFATQVIEELGFSLEKNHPKKVELFPVQDKASAAEKGYGNQIKFPCGLHRGTKKRSRFYMPKKLEKPTKNLKLIKDNDVLARYLFEIEPAKLPTIAESGGMCEDEEEISKLLVEDDESEDKTFNFYLKHQLFCTRILFRMKNKTPLTRDHKIFIARNFHLEGAPIRKIFRFFMSQPDFNKKEATGRIEKVLENLITEIYNSKLENPKDESIDVKNEKLSRKTIRDKIKAGKYKSWKVGCEDKKIKGKKIKGFKSVGGDFLKKEICGISCQSKKNVIDSIINGGYPKAMKSLFIPVFQQIWKIIDIEENREKIRGRTYVHVSQEELQKILDKNPSFFINSTYHLIPMLTYMNLIETKKDGKYTFDSRNYSGRKYRFNKDKIDDIINPQS